MSKCKADSCVDDTDHKKLKNNTDFVYYGPATPGHKVQTISATKIGNRPIY